MEAIKPIYRDLSSPDLLKKCLHGNTQNPNESFHYCIWERIPKTVFVSINTLKVGVLDAVVCFNDGCAGRVKVLNKLGIEVGCNTTSGLNTVDRNRLIAAEKLTQQVTREARIARRSFKRKREEQVPLEQGDYGAGMFYLLPDDPIEVRWSHLALLVEFALELKKALQGINEQSFNHFVLKMGINHGPITAGVIGARKPHYDIWGNSVNVASRMESTGKAGCIQVTDETTEILRHFGYVFEQRGLVSVKGKGQLMTYYLIGKGPPPSAESSNNPITNVSALTDNTLADTEAVTEGTANHLNVEDTSPLILGSSETHLLEKTDGDD